MRNKAKKRSIIPHTTTCPYCGHRVLPKNLKKHIQEQHPIQASKENFSKKIRKKEPSKCPYCDMEIDLNKLEDHVRKEHPKEVKAVTQQLKEKMREEQAKTRKRLKNVAKQFNAKIVEDNEYDKKAPWEWRLAKEKPASRHRNTWKPGSIDSGSRNEWTVCSVCGVRLKKKSRLRHMRKVHG